MGTQERYRVGKEASRPAKPKAVEKTICETELMFIVSLSCLDPGTTLVKESLRDLAVGGNGSIKDFMFGGGMCELFWTGALLPTAEA